MAVPDTEAMSVTFILYQYMQFCCLNLAKVTCLNDSKVLKVAPVDDIFPYT